MIRLVARFVALVTVFGACAGADPSAGGATASPVPIVDQIGDAIAAVEAELGGPQEYFEINATARLINLFVAVDDRAGVQPWLYFEGELTADETVPAEGGVLRAADIDFDPLTIFAALQAELPDATIETFYLHGDGQGAVRYSALLTTAQGGAIDVQLAADGRILATEPLN